MHASRSYATSTVTGPVADKAQERFRVKADLTFESTFRQGRSPRSVVHTTGYMKLTSRSRNNSDPRTRLGITLLTNRLRTVTIKPRLLNTTGSDPRTHLGLLHLQNVT